MQIAIASTDGETVNEHFGKTDRFFIYDLTEGRLALLKVSSVTPLSTGDPSHAFDPERLAKTIAALKGCERVYCVRIGDRPKEELKKAGIEPVVETGPIAGIRG
jgi:predicted Fe-Mo cluster-binding NifX family protein